MKTNYENFVIALAAMLNSIAGIVVDLYAPCLPAIAKELQISSVTAQNTIGVSIIGYAVGQIIFGVLCDWKGRKFSIILGLLLFSISSLFATVVHSIEMLMLARVVQGCAAGSCQVVARAMVIDEVKGTRFTIAVVYLSIAFALGLIVGPYLGAVILQLLNWRWNFVFYAVYSFMLLCVVLYGMRESLAYTHVKLPSATITSYREILSSPMFILSFIQLGCCFVAFTLWNQIGPFIVQHQLKQGATYFGLIALASGVSYLIGALLNRFLIPHTLLTWRLKLSSWIFALGIALLMFSWNKFELNNLVLGLMLITLAQGIAFPNVLSQAMSIFPEKAGVSASLQGAGMLIMGSLGLGLISLSPIKSSATMGIVYGILLVIFLGSLSYTNKITLKEFR